ncbi:roadblock/LC7 domain-containing protein [Streptosporangium sp. NPDC048047]|uniref:roadblock/LC7 domain-containing protein n=1 Tax=Streptosporangium sp. NPDC048047 TaxID=3155748 RepID=UPI00341215FA
MEARDREPQATLPTRDRPYPDPAASRDRDVVPFRESGAESPGPAAGASGPSGPSGADTPGTPGTPGTVPASPAQAPSAPDGEGVSRRERARRELALLRDRLHEEMALLRERVPEVNGSIACSVDGLTLASDLRGETEQIGALSSAVLALSSRLTAMADKGSFEETLISGDNGYAAFYAAGPTIVLTVLARPGTNLGLLRLEGRKTAVRMAALTSRTSTPH